MSISPAAVTLRPFLGWLHPDVEGRIDHEAVLRHLREQRVLGAVQSSDPGVEGLCSIVLLLDDVERIQVVRDGKVAAGAPLSRFGPELAEILGLDLEIAGDYFEDPARVFDEDGEGPEGFDLEALIGEQESDPTHDVLVSRVVESSLPALAHSLKSSLSAGHEDGWTVIHFDDAWVDLSEHGWMPGDLPAVRLSRVDDTRHIQVLTAWNDPVGLFLTRRPDLTATFTAAEVDHAGLAELTNPHLSPDSDTVALLTTRRFRDLDATALTDALQSPMDDRWVNRVLAAMGLPTLAGDLLEGRRELTAPTRVEFSSGWRALLDTVVRYVDAPASEVSRRTPIGKFYAKVYGSTPLGVATVAVETVAGAALLARSRRAGTGAGARRALVGGASFLLVDAVSGLTIIGRRALGSH
ncbi:hypothetical protein [Nocardioides gilvus]|uniref:hypothetical protein n=1 Tax=Nocardioides gilvus TaxID=1735589 RepID=UPI000D74400B|nr:hypothetical protein [Nocardioides gilvus]